MPQFEPKPRSAKDQKLRAILELRDMLRVLEIDVGIDELSRTEREVLLAAHALCQRTGNTVKSESLRRHPLVRAIPQATLYRAIQTLLTLGLLERAPNTKAKSYVLRSDLLSRRPPPG